MQCATPTRVLALFPVPRPLRNAEQQDRKCQGPLFPAVPYRVLGTREQPEWERCSGPLFFENHGNRLFEVLNRF